jgi:type III pantothenate kinase
MNDTAALPVLAVDIGNSSIKFGLFEATRTATWPEATWVVTQPTREEFGAELILKLPEKVEWVVASVQRQAEQRLLEWIEFYRRGDVVRRLTLDDLPLQVNVDFPQRVGVDRLCAAVAVNRLRAPNQAAVVIGAGSAMTIDLVSPDGVFQGGTILAGFRMCAESLASVTDLLPLALLEPSETPPPLPGKNTEAAIRAGLFWGAVGAAREMIARYAEIHPQLQVFVSGGDLARLAPLLSDAANHRDVQFIPNLVLSGIAIASTTTVSE